MRWKRKLGALAAASPAYADGRVYVVLLQRSQAGAARGVGRVVALDGKTRQDPLEPRARRAAASPRRWSTTAALYFGSENGTVYALSARDGERALALPGRAAR